MDKLTAVEAAWLAANEVETAHHEGLYGSCTQGCCFGGVSENAIRTALEVAEPYFREAAHREARHGIAAAIGSLVHPVGADLRSRVAIAACLRDAVALALGWEPPLDGAA